jgi:hypothetical protein
MRRIIPVHRLILLAAAASFFVKPVHAQSARAANTPEANQQTFSSADEALAALTSTVITTTPPANNRPSVFGIGTGTVRPSRSRW